MCTIIAIKGRHPRFGLILAANRDELYARPADPPRIVHDRPRVLAGRDREGGGSWLGATEDGLFVALTNQRQHGGTDPARRSRGHVVLEALRARRVDAMDAYFEGLDARDYNSFNVLYGDAGTLRVAYARHDRRALAVETLQNGLWVLPNDEIGSAQFPKAERAIELAEPLADRPWDELGSGLQRALADHRLPPLSAIEEPPPGSMFDRALLQRLQALCIHTPLYGTRSATILALEPGRVAHYLHAEGQPCEAPFVEMSDRLL